MKSNTCGWEHGGTSRGFILGERALADVLRRPAQRWYRSVFSYSVHSFQRKFFLPNPYSRRRVCAARSQLSSRFESLKARINILGLYPVTARKTLLGDNEPPPVAAVAGSGGARPGSACGNDRGVPGGCRRRPGNFLRGNRVGSRPSLNRRKRGGRVSRRCHRAAPGSARRCRESRAGGGGGSAGCRGRLRGAA